FQRMPYGTPSDAHKQQFAPAQFRDNRPSKYVIVQGVITQHSRSRHDEEIAPLQPSDPFEPSIRLKQWIGTDTQRRSPPVKDLEPPIWFHYGSRDASVRPSCR